MELPQCPLGHDFLVNAFANISNKQVQTADGETITVAPIYCLECGHVFGVIRLQ